MKLEYKSEGVQKAENEQMNKSRRETEGGKRLTDGALAQSCLKDQSQHFLATKPNPYCFYCNSSSLLISQKKEKEDGQKRE